MPRRELSTEPQRLAFTEPATEEREMVRHYTLSSEDLALIDRRRGHANRLGFAVLLCYLPRERQSGWLAGGAARLRSAVSQWPGALRGGAPAA